MPINTLACWTLIAALLLAEGATGLALAQERPPEKDSLNTGATAVHVLEFGFETIRQRYLNDIDLDQIAGEGINGLSTIDPAITVGKAAPKRLALRYHDQKIGSYALPPKGTAEGWAQLIADLARDAAQRSKALREIGNEKLYEAVFDASLSRLDIFSRYAGAEEAHDHQAARDGFGGIGIRYQIQEKGVMVIEVMPDTPAAEANMEIGDRLLAIDGVSIAGLDREDIAHRLRGAVGSSVTLSFQRKERDAAKITLERRLIVPPTVAMSEKNGIALVSVSSFNGATAQATAQALQKARAAPDFKGVILDLRGNPGGLLDQGVLVADLFVGHGRIVSAQGRHPASIQVYDAKPGDIGEDMPLVVLIDGASASAAEIVAAALQDAGRAVLVGTNSYGKGTVQTVVHMPNDGEMTLTWSRFHSPSGYALHGLGVLPVVCTANERQKASALLAPLRQGMINQTLPKQFAAWRASAVDDVKGRKQLRQICPAARHAATALDLDIGRALIEDRALYDRARRLSDIPGAASMARGH